ncbi:MAG: carbamoyltransferase HypF [Gemmatimonadaceae bacterium]
MNCACSIKVRGVVQGVGFRPFVFRLARENTLAGWVLNAGEGVEIHLEGPADRLHTFVRELSAQAPPAAAIAGIDIEPASPTGLTDFEIRESARQGRPTARISPDLPVCDRCLHDLFEPSNVCFAYPYISCTDCGPRYSIILALPYDREATTMAEWRMDDDCACEYHDPSSRRFHAQPIACGRCGPHYELRSDTGVLRGDTEVVHKAAELLREGKILAVKGLGGYHLVCDARNASAVTLLRERKFRKEKPFALMVSNLEAARALATISAESLLLLTSVARPIVLVPATAELPGVAPDNDAVGIMLPYTPLHHLLFASGAPEALVMTSANRSSEPIAYEDDDAVSRLEGIADAFLVGERPIARRVEDSVARAGAMGPVILRRSRGYAPGAVATLPVERPILALGADLKSAITLVVEGQAFVSQHLGDLVHYQAFRSFEETIRDLLHMYDVRQEDLLVVRDCHPEYFSTTYAKSLDVPVLGAVQHHRAHAASVLAERGAWERRVLGVALDGTGFGDDGTIWGGELFVGSVALGFDRVAHLRQAKLVGGDAAAQYPVQAAAGFLDQLDALPEFDVPPFRFSSRYRRSLQLLRTGTRVFSTTSAGRLFDAVSALLGFTRAVTFEGQAAIWLEQLARKSSGAEPYEFPFIGAELDFRPLLRSVVHDRVRGRDVHDIARAFHLGLARGLRDAIVALCESHGLDTVVAAGGVFQNEVLLGDLSSMLQARGLELWTNHVVPTNDGGISLGQAALAAFGQCDAYDRLELATGEVADAQHSAPNGAAAVPHAELE